ncbi:hypothetical protein AAY473_009184 [Plecturocebus cupreus]
MLLISSSSSSELLSSLSLRDGASISLEVLERCASTGTPIPNESLGVLVPSSKGRELIFQAGCGGVEVAAGALQEAGGERGHRAIERLQLADCVLQQLLQEVWLLLGLPFLQRPSQILPNFLQEHFSILGDLPQQLADLLKAQQQEADHGLQQLPIRKVVIGGAWWLTPVIPVLWEAEVGEPQGQVFETSLTNMLLGRLRQENRLNLGGRGCSESRLRQCTPAWVTDPDPTPAMVYERVSVGSGPGTQLGVLAVVGQAAPDAGADEAAAGPDVLQAASAVGISMWTRGMQ